MMKKICNLIICLALGTVAYSQNIAGLHQLRADDQVEKQAVTYSAPTEGGQDIVWDFQGLEEQEASHKADYQEAARRKGIIVGTEHATLNYYRQTGDSLLLWGYENNLERVEYDRPILLLHTPLQYGEQWNGMFHGTKAYCEKLFSRVFGIYSAVVDATGIMLLPSGDTLRHVSRVHITEVRAEQQYHQVSTAAGLKALIDSMAPYTADSIRNRMNDGRMLVQTDTYRWYAAGYRYPVLETIITGPLGKDPVYAASLYCAPEEQEKQADDENGQLRELLAQQASASHGDGNSGDKSAAQHDAMSRCDVAVNGQTVTVTYDLTDDATVTGLICTVSGMALRQQSQHFGPGSCYHMELDCGGLHTGVYVLSLNVNGKVTSHTVSLK